MKKKYVLQPTKKVIPDGEGFNALPIAFVYDNVIARKPKADVAIFICMQQEIATLALLVRNDII
jgi:hypothetical protein